MLRQNRDRRTPRRRHRRILIIIENVPLSHDHRAQKQVRTLIAAGYPVAVITQRHADNLPYRSIAGLKLYEYIPPRSSTKKLSFVYEYAYSWLAALVLTVKAFARGGFGGIQAGCPPEINFLLAMPFRLLGRPFVVDQRDLSPEVYADRYGRDTGAIQWLLRRFERMSWHVADQILCVNGSLRQRILHRGNVQERSVTIVGNGPVLERTAPRAPRPELKEGRTFLACWVGLMGPQDHVDLVLEAVRHLVHDLGRQDCHFALIGDGEVLHELKELARRSDLSGWVTFTGWLDEHRCFDYLASADLGLDSNLQEEVSPVKGMEYMAFGLAFVAFDLQETRSMAEGAAAYVEPGDPIALALAIARLLDDPVQRTAMGELGRRRVEETLAWDRQAERYLGVYDRLLGPRTPL